MPTKRNVTSHISLHGHGRTKFFQTPGRRETTVSLRMTTKTDQANIRSNLTVQVFEKHTFFV